MQTNRRQIVVVVVVGGGASEVVVVVGVGGGLAAGAGTGAAGAATNEAPAAGPDALARGVVVCAGVALLVAGGLDAGRVLDAAVGAGAGAVVETAGGAALAPGDRSRSCATGAGSFGLAAPGASSTVTARRAPTAARPPSMPTRCERGGSAVAGPAAVPSSLIAARSSKVVPSRTHLRRWVSTGEPGLAGKLADARHEQPEPNLTDRLPLRIESGHGPFLIVNPSGRI